MQEQTSDLGQDAALPVVSESNAVQPTLQASEHQDQDLALLSDVHELPEPPEELLALYAVIDRLETLLEEENEKLLHNEDFDLDHSSFLKGKALLDLERAEKIAIGGGAVPAHTQKRMAELRELIDLNMRLLATQLNAVKDITEKLSQTMRDLDSDGTYAAPYGHW
ncbi:hypothetical protein [Polycladidibacter hongkongensis]|uniref:hypothetical protein n=1 Tax=Polycladidibacter hongkongensis TaxID=1647556 RepID=UPI0008371212|nr:hypothetical protein [Pseudovibrio hongkongensis]